MRRKHFQIISLLLFGLIGLPSAIAQISLKQAQQYLQIKGLYAGKIDGLAGPQTRQAIIAYQKAEGLPVSGTLDPATAEKLANYIPGNINAQTAPTTETIIVVQEIPEVEIVEEQDIEVVEQDVNVVEQSADTAKDAKSDSSGTVKGAVQEADRSIGGEIGTAKTETEEAAKSAASDASGSLGGALKDAGSSVKSGFGTAGSAIGEAGGAIKGVFGKSTKK